MTYYIYECSILHKVIQKVGEYKTFHEARIECDRFAKAQNKNNIGLPTIEQEHNIFVVSSKEFSEHESIEQHDIIY